MNKTLDKETEFWKFKIYANKYRLSVWWESLN